MQFMPAQSFEDLDAAIAKHRKHQRKMAVAVVLALQKRERDYGNRRYVSGLTNDLAVRIAHEVAEEPFVCPMDFFRDVAVRYSLGSITKPYVKPVPSYQCEFFYKDESVPICKYVLGWDVEDHTLCNPYADSYSTKIYFPCPSEPYPKLKDARMQHRMEVRLMLDWDVPDYQVHVFVKTSIARDGGECVHDPEYQGVGYPNQVELPYEKLWYGRILLRIRMLGSK
jgi:hypothetical protein